MAPVALGPGITLASSPAAGTIFAQPWYTDEGSVTRLDDVLGAGAWLISRQPIEDRPVAGLQTVALDDLTLLPFREQLTRWLDERAADAVLVRPDRYVFGTGEPGALAEAWASALTDVPDLEEAA